MQAGIRSLGNEQGSGLSPRVCKLRGEGQKWVWVALAMEREKGKWEMPRALEGW